MATMKEILAESAYDEYSQENFDLDILINQAYVLEKEIESLDFYINNYNYNVITEYSISDDYYFNEDTNLNNNNSKEDAEDNKANKKGKLNNILKNIGSKLKNAWNWIVDKVTQFWNWFTKKIEGTKEAWNKLLNKIKTASKEQWDKIKVKLLAIRQKFAKWFKMGDSDNPEDDINIGKDKCKFNPNDKDEFGPISIDNAITIMNEITKFHIWGVNWNSIKGKISKASQEAQKNGIIIDFDKVTEIRQQLNDILKTTKSAINDNNKKNSSDAKKAKEVLNIFKKVILKTISLYGKAGEMREQIFKAISSILVHNEEELYKKADEEKAKNKAQNNAGNAQAEPVT